MRPMAAEPQSYRCVGSDGYGRQVLSGQAGPERDDLAPVMWLAGLAGLAELA